MVLVFAMMWHCLHLLELLWISGYVVCSFVIDHNVVQDELCCLMNACAADYRNLDFLPLNDCLIVP